MKKMLDPALQREADALADLPDETIDASDIPEAPVDAWRQAIRPGLKSGGTRSVTLQLDVAILAWFEEHAGRGAYQAEINRVLRRHVASAERQSV